MKGPSVAASHSAADADLLLSGAASSSSAGLTSSCVLANPSHDHYQDSSTSSSYNNHHHSQNHHQHNDPTTNQSSSVSAFTAEIFQQSIGRALGAAAESVANSSLVSSTGQYYKWLSSFADPRVESWPMMSSPMPTLALFALYLIVANYGPSLMRTRKPLQLRSLLVIYNLYVSLLNLWIACELCYCSYKLRYRSMCQLVLITNDPYVMRIANGVWWYYASKGIEFADTLFFILRKKDRQLTFLHKYHHSSMFIVWWTAARFVPGGSAIIPIVVNSLVHVLMYAYYGLSALGPHVQKYLWWKRYLTIIQLIQFFVGVSIGIHLITSNCQFTRWMQYVFSGYAFSFIILFGNFYLNEYIKGRQQKSRQSQQRQQNGHQLGNAIGKQQQQQANGVDKIKQT